MFCYKKHFFAYIYKDYKGKKLPYLAFNKGNQLEHPILASGERKLIQVVTFHPEHDLPAKQITKIMEMAIRLVEKD